MRSTASRRRRPSRRAPVVERPHRRHFARDSIQVLGGQVAMTFLGLVNGIIAARWLGPTARGQFQLLTLLPIMLSNFVKLGIPQASVYYMRRRVAARAARPPGGRRTSDNTTPGWS